MGKSTIPDAILLDIENSKVCFIENELIQNWKEMMICPITI